MGGLAKLVKDIKCSVENLEKKEQLKEDNDIQEIVEAQQVIDAIIVANSDAIKRIDKEIKDISVNKLVKEVHHDIIEEKNVECEKMSKKGTIEKQTSDKVARRSVKKCRYYNRGYCKYKQKCKYSHPKEICKEYLTRETCENIECCDRHPRVCKWIDSNEGCKRQKECDYLHVTIACDDSEYSIGYKCISCKDTWKDSDCVVKHIINGRMLYFCLNCDDWVARKSEVIQEGWTLLDGEGFLRRDV